MINWMQKYHGYGLWTSGESSASNTSTDTDTVTVGSSDTSNSSSTTSQLVLDDDAISSYIDDALSAADGLADIFTDESTAGLYDSTVSTNSTSDLMANITSELAELTGTTTTSSDEETATDYESAVDEDSDQTTVSAKLGFSL